MPTDVRRWLSIPIPVLLGQSAQFRHSVALGIDTNIYLLSV